MAVDQLDAGIVLLDLVAGGSELRGGDEYALAGALQVNGAGEVAYGFDGTLLVYCLPEMTTFIPTTACCRNAKQSTPPSRDGRVR